MQDTQEMKENNNKNAMRYPNISHIPTMDTIIIITIGGQGKKGQSKARIDSRPNTATTQNGVHPIPSMHPLTSLATTWTCKV